MPGDLSQIEASIYGLFWDEVTNAVKLDNNALDRFYSYFAAKEGCLSQLSACFGKKNDVKVISTDDIERLNKNFYDHIDIEQLRNKNVEKYSKNKLLHFIVASGNARMLEKWEEKYSCKAFASLKEDNYKNAAGQSPLDLINGYYEFALDRSTRYQIEHNPNYIIRRDIDPKAKRIVTIRNELHKIFGKQLEKTTTELQQPIAEEEFDSIEQPSCWEGLTSVLKACFCTCLSDKKDPEYQLIDM